MNDENRAIKKLINLSQIRLFIIIQYGLMAGL